MRAITYRHHAPCSDLNTCGGERRSGGHPDAIWVGIDPFGPIPASHDAPGRVTARLQVRPPL